MNTVREGYTQSGAQYSIATSLGKDVLLLNGFQGEEALSAPFRLVLDLRASKTDIDPGELIGTVATVSVKPVAGATRYFSGIIARFAQSGGGAAYAVYEAELRPACILMSLASDRRIFQNQSVPDIVQALLNEFGIAFALKLQANYAVREYCVQFDETALDFISRILAEEGIFYFFTHSADGHTMVLADSASGHPACPAIDTVNYWSDQPDRSHADIVYRFDMERRIVPDSLSLSDFDFTKPSTSLLVDAGAGKGAQFRFPGGYTDQSDGKRLAKMGLQALQREGQLVRGDGRCHCFTAGHAFTLAGHFRNDMNTAFVLSYVSHRGDLDGYSNRFEAFPKTVPYRPALRDRPRIHGSHTARVVGKQGEEIWTDQYGRVKLHFPWDRKGKADESSSCWVRVAQGWAGQGWGSLFVPRIGMEVIVGFIEGDADRPLVTGCVYNAEQTVPYSLPGNQTRSTLKTRSSKGAEGGNELRFEDKADAEEVYVFAQKDMNVVVTQNHAATVSKGNDTLTVSEGNRTISIEKGTETHKVGGERQLTVDGKETHTNKAEFQQTIQGKETRSNQADFEQSVGGNYTLKVTGNLVLDVGGSITFKSGSDATFKSGTGLELDAGTSMTVKSGASMAIQSGTSLVQKAGTTGDIEAGATLNVKAGAMGTVDGGSMLTLKGGIVKVN